MADKRRVQRIHPDHAAFGAFMHMLVPGHGGRNYQIADFHRTALAVNDGSRPFALDDEPQRVHIVAMRARLLPRHQYLKTTIDVGCRRDVIGRWRGVLEIGHASFRGIRIGRRNRLIEQWFHILPSPVKRGFGL